MDMGMYFMKFLKSAVDIDEYDDLEFALNLLHN